MKIALAQLNPTVGDIAGNTKLVIDAVRRGADDGADVLVCSEMVLLGYPPRDYLARDGVVEACEQAVMDVAAAAEGIAVVVGHVRRTASGIRGVRNCASVVQDGRILAVYDKRLLPGYDVFDEDRYFDAGTDPCVVELPFGRLGLLICEDIWRAGDVVASPAYDVDPLEETSRLGCDAVVCLNASPFVLGKYARHIDLVRSAARRAGVPIAVVNQVGGMDDLIFDGRSVVVDASGHVVLRLPDFTESVGSVELPSASTSIAPEGDGRDDDPKWLEELFHGLVLGLRDYCGKSGQNRVTLGLSGGIDSAVTACIAAAALGGDAVHGVRMPSKYSSEASNDDALALAEGLGLASCREVGIREAHEVLHGAVGAVVPAGVDGVPDENIQARLRGLILMAISNAEGGLVLVTSNKSELAVGYSTLYGDLCGAVAVLGDVLKTRVYDLARWINDHPDALGGAAPPIPERSITRPPSAELRPDQTDQDSLPPYEVLDAIVEAVVDHERDAAGVVEITGFDPALVERTIRMIDRNEYKRFQGPIILKVTQRAFGRGRPMPIVMKATGRRDSPRGA